VGVEGCGGGEPEDEINGDVGALVSVSVADDDDDNEDDAIMASPAVEGGNNAAAPEVGSLSLVSLLTDVIIFTVN